MKINPALIDLPARLFLTLGMGFVKNAPRSYGYALTALMCKSAYYLLKSRRRVGIENLKVLYPDASEEKLEEILYKSYLSFSRFMAEFCFIPSMKPENLDSFIKFENFERIEKAHSLGRGVIVPTAHYDHFEMMNAALSVKGLPVHSVIREVDFPAVDELFDNIRSSVGLKVIKRENASREIIDRLRRGNVVTIATDQNASFNCTHVKFMGKWASTFKSPAVIHLRTGAPIIPLYSVREKDDTHTAYVLPEIKIRPTGALKRDVFGITQAIADVQAKFISERPELWFWVHRRWKNQPTEKELKKLMELASNGNAAQGDLKDAADK